MTKNRENTTNFDGSTRWMRITLLLAGVYNVTWGAWVSLFPQHMFEVARMPAPLYPWLWQTIGMTIFVFGVAYLLVHRNPLAHWPIVAVGLLGRVLGLAGYLYSYSQGLISLEFGLTIITNDVIWIAPFALILWRAHQHHAQP